MAKPLSPSQQQAVLLEAEGYNREEISKLGVASPGTISRWRAQPEYKQAIATLAASNIASIEPLFQKIRVEILQAATISLQTLLEAQEAMTTDHDGNEIADWPTRSKAAIGVLDKLREAGILAGVGQSNDDQQNSSHASAAVIIVKDGETATETTSRTASKTEVIEGTGVEE